MFHIGSSDENLKGIASNVCKMMSDAGVSCFHNDNIKHEIWKKLMLNVAGNAITALTGIDYCMFANSKETQQLCRTTMEEFVMVAKTLSIDLNQNDIDDIINYFLSFKVSKRTSMLEDVLNSRPTENDYIAGYIYRLAKENNILVALLEKIGTFAV